MIEASKETPTKDPFVDTLIRNLIESKYKLKSCHLHQGVIKVVLM